ncbi:MAG: hypothetical protein N2316_09510 [Spirochaetes bacterium]|nr:hypothetical protein [Spirochaetota bacterium]
MNIRIKEVSVENCGPIAQLEENFSDINLIYGKNEKGKSYLVEFIIQSLFKNKSSWQRLRQQGNGRLVLSINDELKNFTIRQRLRLEDFFANPSDPFPPLLFPLLVVKEGETKIVASDEAGIDKTTIADLFSRRKIFETILSKISSTIKSAELSADHINIQNRGEGKNYLTIQKDLSTIENLIEEISNKLDLVTLSELQTKKVELLKEKEILHKAKRHKAYLLSKILEEKKFEYNKISNATLTRLKELHAEFEKKKELLETKSKELKELETVLKKKEKTEDAFEQQKNAAGYKAYTLAKKIEEIENQLLEFNEREISKIEQKITEYRTKKTLLENTEKDINALKEKSKDYNWLKAAKDSYLKLISSPFIMPKYAHFINAIFVIGITCGIGALMLNYRTIGVALVFVGALAVLYYLFLLKKSYSSGRQNAEISNIALEFKSRFKIPLSDIATLESILHQQERAFYELENKEKEAKNLENELRAIEDIINSTFKKYFSEKEKPQISKWENYLEKIQQSRKEKQAELTKTREKLAQLNISQSEYTARNPQVEYNPHKYEELKKELVTLQQCEKDYKKRKAEIENLDAEITSIQKDIAQVFHTIIGKEIDVPNIRATIEKITQNQEKLKEEIDTVKGELSGLGVPAHEYLEENPGRKYSHDELQTIEIEINTIEQQIEKYNNHMSTLKHRIISITQAHQNLSWNQLFEKLIRKKEEKLSELQDLEAQIIAGKLISETIQEFQTMEENEITNLINNSRTIQDALFNLTGRYSKLRVEGNEIFIADDSEEFFNLKDLSTGAKEQVMLALRIGFAKQILQGATAFFILDDAFQHSDYDRRELLVKSLFDIANRGWQIIYLSMDDHIRSLFQKHAKGVGTYKEIILN